MVIHYQFFTKKKMDLRNRTIPERLTGDRVPSDESECREPQQSSEARSSPTLLLDDDGFNVPFDMEVTSTFRGVPQPSPGARDKETPVVRWPMPPMMQGEPPRDFEDDMRGFMEGERYPSCSGNPRECPQDREVTPENISTSRPTERPQFVTPIVRDERAAHSVYGQGAAGGSAPHESTMRQGGGHSRSEDHHGDERNGRGPGYERLLPAGSRPRGRASAHRPPGYFYEENTPRYDRIPEFLFNEPRPYFPTFSGRQDEWEAFWLKFQLMGRRYSWSEEKQREQLLFCLKDDALKCAATLGPEIRDDLMMFSRSLRDRFSHRTPAETVRASLNNIKTSSKESIQEYASRVREMMTKAYPDIGMSETFNQMMINHLLQGLPDQSIAYEVLIRKPRTLSQAVDMITWHECCKETTRKKSGIRHVSTYDNNDESAISREDVRTLDVRRINGKRFVTEERLIQFGRELKTSIEKLFKDERTDQQDQGSQLKETEEPMPRRSNFKNIICFYCNEPGHVASRCPVRLAKETLAKKAATEKKQSENGDGLSQLAGAQTQ